MREIDKTDSYLTKLIKLIPSEAVLFYLIIQNVFCSNIFEKFFPSITIMLFIIIFLLMIAEPVFLVNHQKVFRLDQVVVSTLSILVWVYSIGGPFYLANLYNPLYAGIILTLWTLVNPFLLQNKLNNV